MSQPNPPRPGNVALADLLDEGFDRKAWHGPNLWSALRGVDARLAAWRPAPGRHNIWELVVHAAYWKYLVRRRVTGDRTLRFAYDGSNFFPRPSGDEADQERAWVEDRRLLLGEHRALMAVTRTLDPARLTATQRRNLKGIAFHDVYHAGQIRLLRVMAEEQD